MSDSYSNSDSKTVSITQKNRIKFLFINIFYEILNLIDSKHLRIINCIDLELFIFYINLVSVL